MNLVGPLTLGQIAQALGVVLEGDPDRQVTGVASLETARPCGPVCINDLTREAVETSQEINEWFPILQLVGLISVALAAIGGGAWGMAHSASLAALAAWLLAVGAGGAIDAAVIEASLQRIVPDALRGRVLAARGVASALAVIVVSSLAGPLVDQAGKVGLFGGVAIIALVAAGLVWASGRQWLYGSVRWFFRQLAFAYFRLDVRGLERVPPTGGVLIAGNHPNVLDGLLLLVVSPRPVRFLIAEDMYEHRYLHGLFKGLGCIPVYRRKTHNGDALRAAVVALERGEALGIFPEGTTHFRGSMQEVKKGVGLLALRTGCPVVPFAIHGSDEAFPKGTKAPRPETIRMRFEEPVLYHPTDTNPIPEARVAEVLEDVRVRILGAMRRTRPSWDSWTAPQWIKDLQIALSALIVVPLADFLTCTANPSLDPNKRR